MEWFVRLKNVRKDVLRSRITSTEMKNHWQVPSFLLQKIAGLDIKKLLNYITVSDYYINLLFDFYLIWPSLNIMLLYP